VKQSILNPLAGSASLLTARLPAEDREPLWFSGLSRPTLFKLLAPVLPSPPITASPPSAFPLRGKASPPLRVKPQTPNPKPQTLKLNQPTHTSQKHLKNTF